MTSNAQKQVIRIKAPRLSWADSFATNDQSCPFSPRYRNLAQKLVGEEQRITKSQSAPNLYHFDKENEVNWASKRRESTSAHFHQRSDPNSVFSPRYQATADRKSSVRNELALEAILSPRYTNVQGCSLPFSPRYQPLQTNLELYSLDNESESEFSEDYFGGGTFVFSPRYQEKPLATPEAASDSEEDESVAKYGTVLALLSNLDDSRSGFDEDVFVVE